MASTMPLPLPPPWAEFTNLLTRNFVPKLRLGPDSVKHRTLGSHSKWVYEKYLPFFVYMISLNIFFLKFAFVFCLFIFSKIIN